MVCVQRALYSLFEGVSELDILLQYVTVGGCVKSKISYHKDIFQTRITRITRIDQLKDPRYLRHPRLKDRPLGVLTHLPTNRRMILLGDFCNAINISCPITESDVLITFVYTLPPKVVTDGPGGRFSAPTCEGKRCHKC